MAPSSAAIASWLSPRSSLTFLNTRGGSWGGGFFFTHFSAQTVMHFGEVELRLHGRSAESGHSSSLTLQGSPPWTGQLVWQSLRASSLSSPRRLAPVLGGPRHMTACSSRGA